MKTLGVACVLLLACKTQVSVTDAGPLPSASVPVIEAVQSAPTTLPPPAASIACTQPAECISIESPCCNAWPSNIASKEQVRQTMLASDGERCKTRLCALRMHDATCLDGRCVIR